MYHRTRAPRVRSPNPSIVSHPCRELHFRGHRAPLVEIYLLTFLNIVSPVNASDRVAYEWVEALGWEQRPNEDGTVCLHPICSLVWKEMCTPKFNVHTDEISRDVVPDSALLLHLIIMIILLLFLFHFHFHFFCIIL